MLNSNIDTQEIVNQLNKKGLIVEKLDTSGEWARCPTVDKPNSKNGAYLIDVNTGVCLYKNWGTGEEGKIINQITRRREKREKHEVKDMRYEKIIEAATRAIKMWNEAEIAESTPYTIAKGVKPYGLKKMGNSLIIPLQDKDGKIWSIQFINFDHSKRFLKNGRKKGCFFEIKGSETVILCEGYATGASIHEATGFTVIICFDANNLVEVAKDFPTAIVGADNDISGCGEEKTKLTGLQYVLPPLLDGKSTDFNDLHQAQGLESVKKCFSAINTRFPSFIEVKFTKNGIVESVNRALLAQHIRNSEEYLFVQDEIGSVMPYLYLDGVYKLVSVEIFKAQIKQHITDYKFELVKTADIDEVYKNLMTDGDYIKPSQLNDNINIINFQNGILNIKTKEFVPHAPQVVSTIQIPSDYNPHSKDSPEFEKFMETFTGGDKEKYTFYLQWIGLVISNIPVHKFKKALFIIGKPHSGKSVFLDFITQCIGKDNCASIDLSYLEKNNFATSSIYNKRLAFCADMSFIKIDELKTFKNITGGDAIKIEYKGQKPFSTIYNGALMFNSNSYPKFGGDTSKAVFDRMIVLSADSVLPEKQRDNTLRDKLYAEREAIISKALDELYKVIDNGYKLDIPLEHYSMIDEYQTENNHSIEFFKEYCFDRPRDSKGQLAPIYDSITQKVIYEAFKEWSKQTYGNSYVTSKAIFEKEIKQYLGGIEITKKTYHGNRYYCFVITKEAFAEFVTDGYKLDMKKEIERLEKENNHF